MKLQEFKARLNELARALVIYICIKSRRQEMSVADQIDYFSNSDHI
jgi:hypothetical protein